jgi:hypothetical protein
MTWANPSESQMLRYANPGESFVASKMFMILLGGIGGDRRAVMAPVWQAITIEKEVQN